MSEKHEHKEEYPLKHYRKLRKLVRRKKADIEESAENSFTIDAIQDISQDEIVQTDSEEDDTETDGFFLQPVPIRLRRSLLKLSGVKKVDNTEREECKELRGSREVCGCDCKVVCLPETCHCALNGIQCQVDRFSFPCGCSKKGCDNPFGRIEFNPSKVRKHYQHTMTRLQNEEEVAQSDAVSEASAKELAPAKHSRHIRFSDDGTTVEGEDRFNSTETGCCLDCSLTAVPNYPSDECRKAASHISDEFECAPSSFSFTQFPASDAPLSHADHGVLDTFSQFFCDRAPSSVDPKNHCDGSNDEPESLEPISELLNPILNTTDSLDMYALSHIPHRPCSDSRTDALDNPDSPVLSEWQSLSHESLLTTNSLIPMKDSYDQDSSSSATGSAKDFESLNGLEQPPFTFTGLKPSPLSFQLPSSHNVVHAMNSEFDDLEQCQPASATATLPAVSTEARA